ncbi:MAG: hypothetical protein ABIM96_02005, partial [Candidatus Saccharimonas sp.]
MSQRDPEDALGVAAGLYKQSGYAGDLVDADHDGRTLKNVIVTGMGGSALAADFVKVLLSQSATIPFEVVKSYTLPAT